MKIISRLYKFPFLVHLGLILIFTGCNYNIEYDYELNRSLRGLTKASNEDLIRLSPIKWDKNSAPFYYNIEGERLTTEEYSQNLSTKKFKQVFFINKNSKIRAVVMEPLKNESKIEINSPNRDLKLLSKKAPSFNVTDINGNQHSNSTLKGKLIVINFWFINCAPCRREIPALNRLVKEFGDKDVVFLGFGRDSKLEIKEFTIKNDFSYTHVPVDSKVLKEFGISTFPTNIIIDRKGEVIFVEKKLKKNIYEILRNAIQEEL